MEDCLSEKTDNELRISALQGDLDAERELILRYSRLVKICARPFFLVGGDSEDLIQEGMLGLLSAIRNYAPEEGASFKAYAQLCIRNRLISAVRSASRLKHAPLNEGISLEEILLEETRPGSAMSGSFLQHIQYEPFSRVPEEQVLARESKNEFIVYFSRFLSKYERKILTCYLNGLSFGEIAQVVGKPPKSVDNAVQRIRKKMARYLDSGEFS